ncbi:hypothetical protein PR002_g20751 [Phytophthora rubi]|uniref:Uncharacterized protein n=1 Tax=Phytophthora rubi TaxID=129364 RepID=A0A6A3JC29_9STRA|nr:hypothetical protein PR002_g20751 [Phytophthora rubi]
MMKPTNNVKTKRALLLESVTRKNLKVITATGAGAKADPTRQQIGSLKNAVRDPLATKIRCVLKKKDISLSEITTIFSSEKSVCKLLPLDAEQAQNLEEFSIVENFRIRVIPVLGTMSALFGQSIAAYVLCDLAGKKIKSRLPRDQRNRPAQQAVPKAAVARARAAPRRPQVVNFMQVPKVSCTATKSE